MKLTYFELYGRAEPIRMLLHHSKTEYENKIITAEEFGAMKASGELPCGQVPIFECNGKVMNQSVPILRYLGTKKNYYNPNDFAFQDGNVGGAVTKGLGLPALLRPQKSLLIGHFIVRGVHILCVEDSSLRLKNLHDFATELDKLTVL